MPRTFIDGVSPYRQDRRPYPGRRLVIPARPIGLAGGVPSAATIGSVAMPIPIPIAAIAPDVKTHAQPSQSPPSTPPKPTRQHRRLLSRLRLWPSLMVTAAALILAGTGLLGYQTWQTNIGAQIAYGARPNGKQANSSVSAAAAAAPGANGTDETPVTSKAKQAYAVAPDLPRTISIPKIGVDARVLQGGINSDGSIVAPTGIWDTDWYTGSAKPGEPGNAFINGHISGPTMPAVFVGLKTLKAGDAIQIERGDGSTLNYSVKTVQTVKLTDINMSQVLAGVPGAAQSLTLMTCGGNYQGNYTYDSRVIVQAVRT